MFHMDLELDRVQGALESLGLRTPSCPGIQVVGTNGKGSTSTFLAEILRQSGLRTGLFTSPHFVSPRERILLDGRPLPDSEWLRAAEAVLAVTADISLARTLTYFEMVTAMAAWLFREHGCQACVWEAGLGAAHDATSAIPHHAVAFTPIGLDHTKVLGPTIADIARDKARAMRPNIPAVTAHQPPEARAVLLQTARNTKAALFTVPDDETLAAPAPLTLPTGFEIPGKDPLQGRRLPAPALPGPHQRRNFQLAACAWRLFAATQELPGDFDAVARAARQAFIPGRFQIIPPQGGMPSFVLDGAHNQPGLECLKLALDELDIRPGAMVFTCLSDKDQDAMLPLARSLTAGPVFVPALDAPGRSLDPAGLAATFGPDAQPAPDVRTAIERASRAGKTVLVCGSLYLLAEAYEAFPHWLQRA